MAPDMTSLYADASTPRGRVVEAGRACIGLPYRWGGNVPDDGGLDCSGHLQWSYCRGGIEPYASLYPSRLDRTARGLWDSMPDVYPAAHVLPGDASFYGARDRAGNVIAISHVVLVTRVAPGGFVEEVVGASRGRRGLVDPEEARKAGAVVRAFVAGPSQPAHLYRADWIGFRRCPDDAGPPPLKELTP